jgi:hypothetical protein
VIDAAWADSVASIEAKKKAAIPRATWRIRMKDLPVSCNAVQDIVRNRRATPNCC